MKRHLTILAAFIVFGLPLHSASSDTLAKHHFEFQITPSADYYVFKKGIYPSTYYAKPYEGFSPFIGINFGAQYLYRPIKLFGVSTGLQFKVQGLFHRRDFTDSYSGTRYKASTQYHWAYVSLPIYFHLFKAMKKCSFEFATGPEFNFPVFQQTVNLDYDPKGNFNSSGQIQKYKAEETRKAATLGLSIFLATVKNLSKMFDLFVGPQFECPNIIYFRKEYNENFKSNGGYYYVSVGLKLGLRFRR
jgi:hypothetical protein